MTQRVVIYARCSTRDQELDIQLDGLREYARARGFEVVEEYTDHGVSGARASRPDLDRLMEAAHRREFDVLLVWKLDRLGRSLSHMLKVVEELGSRGIDLISLGDPGLDTTSPAGKLMFSIVAAVGEFERSLIRERTAAGAQAARKRGVKFGRPRTLDEEAKARVRRLRRSGKTIRYIADTLGCSRSVVQRETASA